jgi:hypothetical protein
MVPVIFGCSFSEVFAFFDFKPVVRVPGAHWQDCAFEIAAGTAGFKQAGASFVAESEHGAVFPEIYPLADSVIPIGAVFFCQEQWGAHICL